MIHTISSKILSFIFPSSCYGCKKDGAPLCNECLVLCKKPLTPPYPFIISMYSFKSPLIRKSIHAIKYFRRKDLIQPLAEKIKTEINIRNLSGILTPIPMHTVRKLLRGYNQSEELAYQISVITELPYNKKVLARSILTKRQVRTSSRGERLKNQYLAFKVVGEIQGKDFILIDDVTTTGATLLSARKALIDSGAKNVWAITIAH